MIKLGGTITGRDVTMGGNFTGQVVKIMEPVPFSGQTDNLYRIMTSDLYADGRPIQRVVQA